MNTHIKPCTSPSLIPFPSFPPLCLLLPNSHFSFSSPLSSPSLPFPSSHLFLPPLISPSLPSIYPCFQFRNQVVTVNLTGVSFDSSSLVTTQPIVGDLDLDGFPDVITTVPYKNSESGTIKTQHPLILLGSAGGRLRPQLDLFNEAAVANVTQVAYFDLWEDVSLEK